MGASAEAVRDVARGVLAVVDQLEGDVRWALEEGRRAITHHWSGFASVQAHHALDLQSAAVVASADALAGVAGDLQGLADSFDQAATWRQGARRLGDEAGISLASQAFVAMQQLLEAAADTESRADAWCASRIETAALLAPTGFPSVYSVTIPARGSVPTTWVDRLPSIRPVLQALPSPGEAASEQRLETRFTPSAVADAALRPAAVAGDLSSPVVARDVAARLELRLESESSVPAIAQRARGLLDPARGFSREYVLYDPGSGTIAEVVGDLTLARAVVILVPGVGSSLDHWPAVSRQISALYEALRAEAADRPVAVIGWLGSPVPGNVVEGALQSYAKDGAPRLRRFTEQLGLPSATRVTLVGHSYGAVTVGLAVHEGLRPAAIVGVAGPGFGPRVHGVDDLGGTPTYVLTDPRDPINEVQPVQRLLTGLVGLGIPVLGSYVADRTTGALGIGHLGTDPIRVAGARRLSTGNDSVPRPLVATDVAVHSNYFIEGGLANRQIAAVALGLPVEDYGKPTGR